MSEVTYDPTSHYDRVTHAWSLLLGDELHYGVFTSAEEALPEATRRLTQLMIDAADIESGMSVLDVGCGTGTPACCLALERGAAVTAITTSRAGVKATTARAATLGVEHLVNARLRDGMDNGFPAESFDRVWVLESSHLMRDRDRLLGECARTLRSGTGRIVLCDIVLRRPMPLSEVRRLRSQLALLREVFGDARMEPLSRYVDLAGEHGLDVDAELDLTEATRPTFDCWRSNAEQHRAAVIAALGEENLMKFIDACGVLETFWRDGTLGYGLISATKR